MKVKNINGKIINIDVEGHENEVDKLIYKWEEHEESFNKMLHDVRHSEIRSSSGKRQKYVGDLEEYKLQYDEEKNSYFLKNRTKY